MRHNLLGAALALGMMSMGASVRSATDDVPLLDADDMLPPPPRRAAPRERTKEHKHSREIARRLRQEARAEAKRAARGQS